MYELKDKVKEDLSRNVPKKLPAILSTIFSAIIGVILIVIKCVSDGYSWYLFSASMIIIVLFPVSAWYTSYFAKKQKTARVKAYDAETELIIEYMQFRKNYNHFEENEKVQVTANFEKNKAIGKFKYNEKNSSLGFPDPEKTVVSVGIGLTGLQVNINNGKIENLCGYLPKSIWLKKKLNKPDAIKGDVFIQTKGVELRRKTYIYTNKQGDSYYDKKTGWLCIGDRKTTILDDSIEFLEDAILVIREGKIIALWVKIQPNIKLI